MTKCQPFAFYICTYKKNIVSRFQGQSPIYDGNLEERDGSLKDHRRQPSLQPAHSPNGAHFHQPGWGFKLDDENWHQKSSTNKFSGGGNAEQQIFIKSGNSRFTLYFFCLKNENRSFWGSPLVLGFKRYVFNYYTFCIFMKIWEILMSFNIKRLGQILVSLFESFNFKEFCKELFLDIFNLFDLSFISGHNFF